MKPGLSTADLAPLASLISQRLGLRVDDGSRDRVIDALDLRIRQSGLRTAADYRSHLLSATATPEWRALAQELSIGESYFLRGRDHFDAFCEAVLPQRIRAQAGNRRLRILCAGCAAGEEPYSVAMLLLRQPDLAGWELQVVGTDISPALLAKAACGIYTAWSLRDVPADVVSRHFRDQGRGSYALDPAVRALVHFEERNLLDESQAFPSQAFDAIFCRNVMIYFTQDAIVTLLRRFEQALAPGGYLFLGHSETLRGLTRAYRLCQSHDTFYYQLLDASALPEAGDTALASGTGAIDDAGDSSWIGAIRRSSDRVAHLARPPGAQAGPISVAPLAGDELERARRLFREERYADVASLLRDRAANDADALLLLGAALVSQNRIDEAESVGRRLRGIDDVDADAVYLLALCREHAGDAEGAVRQAQLASYLDTDFAMPHLLAGRLSRRRGELALARRELTQALSLIAHEHSRRTLLFGGGFGRDALAQLCRAELAACANGA